MKFVTYMNNEEETVGINIGEKVILVNEVLNSIGRTNVNSMIELIEKFDTNTMVKIETAIKSNDFNFVL